LKEIIGMKPHCKYCELNGADFFHLTAQQDSLYKYISVRVTCK
jgi:hypothetical protein